MNASIRGFVVGHARHVTPMLHFALTVGFAVVATLLVLLAV